jgi:hypothetical protein
MDYLAKAASTLAAQRTTSGCERERGAVGPRSAIRSCGREFSHARTQIPA